MLGCTRQAIAVLETRVNRAVCNAPGSAARITGAPGLHLVHDEVSECQFTSLGWRTSC
jgi:hypothetical protein